MEGHAPLRFRHPFSDRPSDQRPPCPTLVIHNPPVQTANDAFISLVQSQSGFKRSKVFSGRTGLTCLVEFESTANAFGALYALYGRRPGNRPGTDLRVGFSSTPFEREPVLAHQQSSLTAPTTTISLDRASAIPQSMPVNRQPNYSGLARAGQPSDVLGLVNLPLRFSEAAITAVFAGQPGYRSVQAVRKHGFRDMCLVTFVDIIAASRAIEQLNGFFLPGLRKPIYLIFAAPSQNASFTPTSQQAGLRQTPDVSHHSIYDPAQRALRERDATTQSSGTASLDLQAVHVESLYDRQGNARVATSSIARNSRSASSSAYSACDSAEVSTLISAPEAVPSDAVTGSWTALSHTIPGRSNYPRSPPLPLLQGAVGDAETSTLGRPASSRDTNAALSRPAASLPLTDENFSYKGLTGKGPASEVVASSPATINHVMNASDFTQQSPMSETLPMTLAPHHVHHEIEETGEAPLDWSQPDDLAAKKHKGVEAPLAHLTNRGNPRLFIGGLPSAIMPSELQKLYNAQSGVRKVDFTRRNGRPICFVEFQDTASARQAIETTTGTWFHNRRIKPRMSDQDFRSLGRPCNTVFVSNLPEAVGTREIESLFASQSGYLELSVYRQSTKTHCFVLFRDEVDASNAILTLDGYRIQGGVQGRLQVRFAEKPLRPTKQHPSDHGDISEDEDSDSDWGCFAAASVNSDDFVSESLSDIDTDELPRHGASPASETVHLSQPMKPKAMAAHHGTMVDFNATNAQDEAERLRPIDVVKASAYPMPSSKAFRSPHAVTQNNNWVAKNFISSSAGARKRDPRSVSSPVLIFNGRKDKHTTDEDFLGLKSSNDAAEASRGDLQSPRSPDPRIPLRSHQQGMLKTLKSGTVAVSAAGNFPSMFASSDGSSTRTPTVSNVSSHDDMWDLMPFYDSIGAETDEQKECGDETLASSDSIISTATAETSESQISRPRASFSDLPLEIRHHIYNLLFDSVLVLASNIKLFRMFTEDKLPCSSPSSNGISAEMFPCLKESSSPRAVSKLDYGRRPDLPATFFGRRMVIKNIPFERLHSTRGLSRRTVDASLLLASRQVSTEFSEFAHHRLALAFGSQRSVTQWLMMLDPRGVREFVRYWKRGLPLTSSSSTIPTPFVMNKKDHIRNLCLEIRDIGEPEDVTMRRLRFKYYENWRKACALITKELTSLKQLGVSIYVPSTREDKASQLSLEACWVRPLLEFSKSASLKGVSVTLVSPSNAASFNMNTCTKDTLTAFSEVLRRKMLGKSNEDALAALAESRASSHATTAEAWDAVELSNGLKRQEVPSDEVK